MANSGKQLAGLLKSRKAKDFAIAVVIGLVLLGVVLAFNRGKGIAEGDSRAVSVAAGLGPAPKVGSPAPDFRVQLLDGSYVRLSELKANPVWMVIWATWCPPCRAENPDVEAVYKEEKDNGLVVVGLDLGEPRKDVADYVKRTGLTYLIGLDYDQSIASQYRLTGLPSHFFIDKDGILREIRVGAMNKKTMKAKIEQYRIAQ